MDRPHARRHGLRVKELDGHRLAVYDERTDTGHVLHPACAVVFHLADGTRTAAQLAEEATAETGFALDEDTVHHALAELGAHGLLLTSPQPPDLTRRRLVRRLAAAGAAAAALPLISTLNRVREQSRVQYTQQEPATGQATGNQNRTPGAHGMPGPDQRGHVVQAQGPIDELLTVLENDIENVVTAIEEVV